MSKFFSNYSTPGTSSKPELDLSDHWVGYVRSTKQVIYSPKVDVDPNGHGYVDLGLPSGTLWATQYISSSSNGKGDYFAWGEIETKSTYYWDNYKFGTTDIPTKYNAADGKTVLDLEDDAAHVLWGGTWRIPTIEQINELKTYCTVVYSSMSSTVNVFTSTINGNTLRLGNTGYAVGNNSGLSPSYCFIWSSNVITRNNCTTASSYGTDYSLSSNRSAGYCIRPVLNAQRRFLSQGGWSEPWNIPQ